MTVLARGPASTRRIRIALALVTPLAVVAYLAAHHQSVEAGTDAINVADRGWILLSVACAVLTWLAATGCQLGAIDGSVPVPRLLATQVASSFVSHVLPAGVGQIGLNVRMLRRSGLSSEQAASAVVLNAAAGAVVHVTALLVLLGVAASPTQVVNPVMLGGVIAATVLLGCAAIVVASRLGRRDTPLGARTRAAVAHLRMVLRSPRRAALLWGGSAAILALHIATLVAVLHALDQSAPIVTVAVIYLASSAAGAAIPGPGGFGGFDVLLASALVTSGLTGGYAAATVIGYRAVTVWLPLLPSAATLLVLLRRKVV